MIKNLPANAGNTGNMGLIPGSRRSPRGNGNQSSILAWKIPWTDEPSHVTVHRIAKSWT